MTTKHVEAVYQKNLADICGKLLVAFPNCIVEAENAACFSALRHLPDSPFDSFGVPKLGACEFFVKGVQDRDPQKIFSKIEKKRWPTEEYIVQAVKKMYPMSPAKIEALRQERERIERERRILEQQKHAVKVLSSLLVAKIDRDNHCHRIKAIIEEELKRYIPLANIHFIGFPPPPFKTVSSTPCS